MALSQERSYGSVDCVYNSDVKYERQDYFILGEEDERAEAQAQTLKDKQLDVDDCNSVWNSAQRIRSEQSGRISLPFVYESKRDDKEANYNSGEWDTGEQGPDAIETEGISEENEAILVWEQEDNSSALAEEERESYDENVGTSRSVWEEQSHPPWWRGQDMLCEVRSPLLRLHYEILDFQAFMAPTPSEVDRRTKALSRVRAIVIDLFPNATLEVFGSYATNLYLPTSDIDCVILNSSCHNIPRGLYALSRSLSRRGLVRTVQVIAKARVPIIKFEEKESRINFDISFDKANGPEAAVWVNSILSKNPEIKPLCLVIKLFLQQRELNEVYTGGIGSYSLLVMLYVHVLLHEGRLSTRNSHRRRERQTMYHENNLGSLLLGFFRTFGQDLNYEEVGLSTLLPHFFPKVERGMINEARPFLLAIQDPQVDFKNDLGKNSYNIPKIKRAFEYAYQLLNTSSNYAAKRRPVSVLEKLVRRDTVLANRDKAISNVMIPVSTNSSRLDDLKKKHKENQTHRLSANPKNSTKAEYDRHLVMPSNSNRHSTLLGDNNLTPIVRDSRSNNTRDLNQLDSSKNFKRGKRNIESFSNNPSRKNSNKSSHKRSRRH